MHFSEILHVPDLLHFHEYKNLPKNKFWQKLGGGQQIGGGILLLKYINLHLFAPIRFNNVNTEFNFLMIKGVQCYPYNMGHIIWGSPLWDMSNKNSRNTNAFWICKNLKIKPKMRIRQEWMEYFESVFDWSNFSMLY